MKKCNFLKVLELNLSYFSVQELQNIYRFKHDSSIYCKVSNRACVDSNMRSTHWKLFIRADVIGTTKDVVRGFLRIFTRQDELVMSEKCEKDLFAFCILMQPFIDAALASSSKSKQIVLNNDDRREIERDFSIKLTLPTDEPSWVIKDVQPPPAPQPSRGGSNLLVIYLS